MPLIVFHRQDIQELLGRLAGRPADADGCLQKEQADADPLLDALGAGGAVMEPELDGPELVDRVQVEPGVPASVPSQLETVVVLLPRRCHKFEEVVLVPLGELVDVADVILREVRYVHVDVDPGGFVGSPSLPSQVQDVDTTLFRSPCRRRRVAT